MGDVFDAMNRAKRERSQASPASPQEPEAVPRDPAAPEEGSLPMDQVRADATAAIPDPVGSLTPAPGTTPGFKPAPSGPDSAPATASTQPVAIAVARAAHDDATHRQAAAALAHDPKLNGYAPDVVVHYDRGSLITEQYRAIRTQIVARCRSRRLQTHVLTSAATEEGKSITSINLGIAFAELRNQKILLLEADLRRPSYAHYFGRETNQGLLSLLRCETDEIDQVVHPTIYENLQFMPAGGHEPVKSTELLSSPRMVQILDRLKDRYDYIFIDSPPVVTVTDPCILGALCDAVLLVVRLNKTPSELIERSKRLLRAANCEVAGVILTHQQPDLSHLVYRYTGQYKYYTSQG